MKAVIMESLAVPQEELAELQKPFEAEGVEFVQYDKTTDTAKLIEEAKDADVMILANMPMPEEVIRACENLKFIDVAFTGVDHVGLAAAKEKNITVSNASGYANEAVSELVIGMVISAYRHMRAVEDKCRQGGTKEGYVGNEIRGKTVGIIGLGKIGARTAELFHAFGAKILAHNSRPIRNKAEYVSEVGLAELLGNSDIVVLHCPLTAETKGMIDKQNLSWMKPSAMLVNAARGPVVVSEDLAEALEKGTIAFACIDVFDKEPPLDTDDVLLKAPNTLVTPHVAFATKESMSIRAKIVFDNLRAWMDGSPANQVL